MNERLKVREHQSPVDYSEECGRLYATLETMARQYFQTPGRSDIALWQDDAGATIQLICPRPDFLTIKVTTQNDDDTSTIETMKYQLRDTRTPGTYKLDDGPVETIPHDYFGCVVLGNSAGYVSRAMRDLKRLSESD